MEFVKEDDQWYYAADKDFPLAQSYPEDMASAVGNIQADRELENGDSMEDYGLEEPVYTVEYTDTEGNITQLYFGNMTGEYYYITVGDTGKVYTVDGTVIESLTYSLDDMAQFDDYPSIGSENLVKEVITQNGETTVYDSEDEAQEEDLAGFGLDEASRITVEATYTEDEEEKVLTLYIGNQDGEGSRYVMMNDSRIVYLISDEICNNILNI